MCFFFLTFKLLYLNVLVFIFVAGYKFIQWQAAELLFHHLSFGVSPLKAKMADFKDDIVMDSIDDLIIPENLAKLAEL